MVIDSALLNDCIIVAHCFQKTMILRVIFHDIIYNNTSMMELEYPLWYCIYTIFVETIIT
jgi:hypothetical protein